jgi:membrane protease subunit HflK
MPWSNQSGGNGGGGGGWQGGGGGNKGPWGQGSGGPGGRGPGQPDLEDLIKKGQDKLRDMMPGGGGGGGGGAPSKAIWLIAAVVLVGGYMFKAAYQVQPDQVGIELLFGSAKDGDNPPGLNFHFWPFETVETPTLQFENVENIGTTETRSSANESLMLTSDQNMVDMEFTVLWRISDPRDYLFNIRDQQALIQLIAESVMREVVGQTEAQTLRTTGRDDAELRATTLIQETLNAYEAGVRITGVKIEKADPPQAVADAFEEVQRAKQDQSKFIEEATKYSNRRLGEARGEAAQLREGAEGYRGRVVAEAEGEAQRFLSVFEEYRKAEDVTRRRIYLETMEQVLGDSNLIIIESGAGGSGVVPYLPLPEVQRRNEASSQNAGGQ